MGVTPSVSGFTGRHEEVEWAEALVKGLSVSAERRAGPYLHRHKGMNTTPPHHPPSTLLVMH